MISMKKYYFCVDDSKGSVQGFLEADSIAEAEQILEEDYPLRHKEGCVVHGIGIENIRFNELNSPKPKPKAKPKKADNKDKVVVKPKDLNTSKSLYTK